MKTVANILVILGDETNPRVVDDPSNSAPQVVLNTDVTLIGDPDDMRKVARALNAAAYRYETNKYQADNVKVDLSDEDTDTVSHG